mgnify:CR=1 FL=1
MEEKNDIQKDAIYQRNPDLIGASIDDEMVMMSVEQGQYYGLGGVGPRIWDLLEKPHTLDQLVEQVIEEFEVERAVCEKDMVGFLEQMEEFGLIERA